MKYSPPAFDMIALGRVEQTYRQRLEQEPVDTKVRLSLAWCLAVRAFHEAGQEAMATRLIPDTNCLDECLTSQIHTTMSTSKLPEGSAYCLLKNCLEQATLVLQLSTIPEERREAEKLRALVYMSGGTKALREADTKSNSVIADLTRAILQGLDDVSASDRNIFHN